MDEPKTDRDWLQLEQDIARLFSAAPLRWENGSREELYAGRSSETQRLMAAVRDPAKHILLYGERGIGKTSISNNFWTKYKINEAIIVVHVQAYPSDDFSSLWLRVLEELEILGKFYCKELRSDFEQASPDIVRRELQKLGRNLIPIIIIDEFDQLRAEDVRELTANLLKSLHDNGTNVTILLIGVADNVEELIANHQSLRRVLSLVKLERMSALDLNEILDRRLRLTPLSISDDARHAIVGISCGLPYYVQTLGKFALQNAVQLRRLQIRLEDVNTAIDKFIAESGDSFGESYRRATESREAGNLFEEVILASALTPSDPSGFFRPAEVGKILNLIVTDINWRDFQIQQYLSLFVSEKRGKILLRNRFGNGYHYRFSDATTQPFIIMRAVKDHRIDQGIQFLLTHLYKDKISEAEYQLRAVDAYAPQDKAPVCEEDRSHKISTDPAEQHTEGTVAPRVVENTGQENGVAPASGLEPQVPAIASSTPTGKTGQENRGTPASDLEPQVAAIASSKPTEKTLVPPALDSEPPMGAIIDPAPAEYRIDESLVQPRKSFFQRLFG
jgi:hypothetical protein